MLNTMKIVVTGDVAFTTDIFQGSRVRPGSPHASGTIVQRGRAGACSIHALLEGALAGLLGGVVAVGLTWVTHQSVSSILFPLDWIPGEWIAGGIAAGVVFGVLSSSLAVRRHLREVV